MLHTHKVIEQRKELKISETSLSRVCMPCRTTISYEHKINFMCLSSAHVPSSPFSGQSQRKIYSQHERFILLDTFSSFFLFRGRRRFCCCCHSTIIPLFHTYLPLPCPTHFDMISQMHLSYVFIIKLNVELPRPSRGILLSCLVPVCTCWIVLLQTVDKF